MQKESAAVAHPEDDYLDAIREHSPASTKEVADHVGVTRQGADYRLRQLREAGKVRSKKVGRELIWMLAEADQPANGE